MAVVTAEATAAAASHAYADAAALLPSNDWVGAVQALATGPGLWWRLNEPDWHDLPLSATARAYDSSGHGRNGSYAVAVGKTVGAEVPAERGSSASALSLLYNFTYAAVQQSLAVAEPYLAPGPPMSVAFTFRRNSELAQNPNPIGERLIDNGRFYVSIEDGQTFIRVNGHLTTAHKSALMDDSSHLVVLTVSSTTGRLYIDGSEVWSEAYVPAGSGTSWKVGGRPGFYDDFMVFDYRLSAGEVSDLFDGWGDSVHHTVVRIDPGYDLAPANGSARSDATADGGSHSHTPVSVPGAGSGSAMSYAWATPGRGEPVTASGSASFGAAAVARVHNTETPGWPPGHGPPSFSKAVGRALSANELAGALERAGFADEDLRIGVAVGLAESGGVPTARHENTDGSLDLGVWQINTVHAAFLRQGTWDNVYDNAIMAHKVWEEAGGSWSPWVTFDSGAYLEYMSRASSAADLPTHPYVPLKTNLHSDQPILVPEGISETNHFPAVARIPHGFNGRRFKDGLAVLFRPAAEETLQLGLHEMQGRLKDYSPNWRVADWAGAPGQWGVLAPQRAGGSIFGVVARDGSVTGFRADGRDDVEVRLSGEFAFAEPAHNTDLFASDVAPGSDHLPRLWLLKDADVWWWLDGVGDWAPGPPQTLSYPAGDTAYPILVNPWTSGAYGSPEVWWATKQKKHLRWRLRRSAFALPGGFAAASAVFAEVGPFRGMDMERDDIVFRVVRDPRTPQRLWLIAMQDSLSWGFSSSNDGSNWSRGWSALPGIPARAALLPRPSATGANTGHILHTVASGMSASDAANVVSTPLLPGTGGGQWTPPFADFEPVTNHYGETGPYASYHTGTDFVAIGDLTVHPVGPGVVHLVLHGDASYGNAVGIHHGSGVYTFYAHMQDGSVTVSPGQAVDQSTPLGLMGETGNAFGAHTHVELRFDSDSYHGDWPVNHLYDIEPYLVGSDARPNPPRGVGGTLMATSTGGVPTGAAAARYNLGPVKPHVAYAAAEIAPQFGITTVYGYGERTTPGSDHPLGLALDFMVSDDRGTQLADYVIANAERLHVTYLIWRQQINSVDGAGWTPMEDRGSITANHFDHVHVSFEAGDFPVPDTAANAANDYRGGQPGDAEEDDDHTYIGDAVYRPEFWYRANHGGIPDFIPQEVMDALYYDPGWHLAGVPVVFPVNLEIVSPDPDDPGLFGPAGLVATVELPPRTEEDWLGVSISWSASGPLTWQLYTVTFPGQLGIVWDPVAEVLADRADDIAATHGTSWFDTTGGDVGVYTNLILMAYIDAGDGTGTIDDFTFTFHNVPIFVEPGDEPDPTPTWPGDSTSSLPNDVIAVIGSKTGGTGESERRTTIFERGRDR